MRILALDIGKVRCGIAVSDPQERVASPVCVLPIDEVVAGAPSFQRVLDDWEPEMIVAGLPLTLAGTEGPQARRIRGVVEQIAQSCALPVTFADERLSSAEAKRSLSELGLTEKDKRGKVDMIAAGIFLQSWLDRRASEADASEDDIPTKGDQ